MTKEDMDNSMLRKKSSSGKHLFWPPSAALTCPLWATCPETEQGRGFKIVSPVILFCYLGKKQESRQDSVSLRQFITFISFSFCLWNHSKETIGVFPLPEYRWLSRTTSPSQALGLKVYATILNCSLSFFFYFKGFNLFLFSPNPVYIF